MRHGRIRLPRRRLAHGTVHFAASRRAHRAHPRIDGRPVSAERFAAAFDRVHATVEQLLACDAIDLHTTYFETVTAMAFVIFAEEGVERVVLEVGLGGRLDATNVVQPSLRSRTRCCSDFASVALATVRALNKACAEGNEHQGTGMITANAFFARRMCGESGDNLRSEILDWDTQNLHKRYQFLQKILLDDFGSAARLAEELLRVNAQTGRPDLCVSELMEWPILGEFRKSDQGKKVIATAGASRTVA